MLLFFWRYTTPPSITFYAVHEHPNRNEQLGGGGGGLQPHLRFILQKSICGDFWSGHDPGPKILRCGSMRVEACEWLSMRVAEHASGSMIVKEFRMTIFGHSTPFFFFPSQCQELTLQSRPREICWPEQLPPKPTKQLKAGPPWFEFLVIFYFFAPWYRKSRDASSVKIS